MRLTFPPSLGWLGIAAALVTLGTAGCSAGGESPAQAAGGAGGAPAVPVATAKVEQKSMPLALSVIGTAEAFIERRGPRADHRRR